jgi:hypothetical protein
LAWMKDPQQRAMSELGKRTTLLKAMRREWDGADIGRALCTGPQFATGSSALSDGAGIDLLLNRIHL